MGASISVPPVLVVGVLALVMALVRRVTPFATVSLPGREGIALGLAGLGLAIVLAGVFAFRRHRTTVNPLDPTAATTLVSTGIYRISRNPMYLGFLLWLLAFAVYLANPLTLLGPAGFAWFMNAFQIPAEEAALQAKFGEEFAGYRRRVRKWV